MFRKKQTKILRVKDGKKRLVNSDRFEELTRPLQVTFFLREVLGLKSVKVHNGPAIDLFNGRSRTKFEKYFNHNETVDILIPKSAPVHEWKLESSHYHYV